MSPRQKLSRLRKIILKYDSCLVAFSGGADSAFLLEVASRIIPKDKLLAVTAVSCVYPCEELIFSKKCEAYELGGNKIEAKMSYPTDTQFGRTGFSCISLELAKKKYIEVTERKEKWEKTHKAKNIE